MRVSHCLSVGLDPEVESSPHTNALITVALIMGMPSWPSTQGANATIASTNMHACFIVFCPARSGPHGRKMTRRGISGAQRDRAIDTAGLQLSKVTAIPFAQKRVCVHRLYPQI